MKKFIYISGIVVINFFVFGAIFKVQHWPGANVLITTGLGLFCIAFLPLSFINSYKGNGRKDKSLYIAGFICAFITFIGAMFKIQHWQGANWFLIVGIPLPFLYFLPVYIYHYNKSKEKSAVNFLGVMFLMVYVAIFTAILALNVSRDILNAFNTGEKDIAKTNDILVIRNNLMYENMEKSGVAGNIEKVAALKTKSEELCSLISNLKLELVKAAEEKDSPAIEAGNKINTDAIASKDESAGTTKTMRGSDGVSGKATEIKEQINSYREYLKSLMQNNSESVKNIDELLNTSDVTETNYGDTKTLNWEDQHFPNGVFLITTLVTLGCIETNILMAENEVLQSWNQ
ncbi:MAG: hypothetical protein V1904_02845 [Bacteroidota bacterium]